MRVAVTGATGFIACHVGCHPYPDYEPMAFWGRKGRLQSVVESTP